MKCIPWKTLKTIVPWSRVHVGRLEEAGQFPKRVQLGKCRVCWMLHEITAYLETRMNTRRSQ